MSERNSLKCGVIGVGYLGALHASKYAAIPDVELVGVYDVNAERAAEVAADVGCDAVADMDELLDRADAVSVAVPTTGHAEVGLKVASAGVHMLMEKPLAHDLAGGRAIAEAAEKAGVVVQVGHLERFNPVFVDLKRVVGNARFIECHRLSPFAGRGVDTDVVFDVMIHDLDILSYVVGRPVVSVTAIGVPVLSDRVDIANARLTFDGGCIANVTASRVSLKRERKLRIFQEDAYVSIDFDGRSALVANKRADPATVDDPMDAISAEHREFGEADPLAEQIASFAHAVRNRNEPAVGLTEGLDALALADLIVRNMEVPSASGTGS